MQREKEELSNSFDGLTLFLRTSSRSALHLLSMEDLYIVNKNRLWKTWFISGQFLLCVNLDLQGVLSLLNPWDYWWLVQEEWNCEITLCICNFEWNKNSIISTSRIADKCHINHVKLNQFVTNFGIHSAFFWKFPIWHTSIHPHEKSLRTVFSTNIAWAAWLLGGPYSGCLE